ncbi:MAG: hypothetical protein NTW14_02215 [bacterium]|nr:hypothetical protein [bacterium]
MNNIKEITPDPAIGTVGRGQLSGAKGTAENERKPAAAEEIQQDQLQVDDKRRDETRLVENAKLMLGELPEVRTDKVELARQRMQEGYYDRPEVLQAAAEKIAKQEIGGESDQINPQNVQRARQRIVSGYYDQQQVLDQTAEKIVKGNR